MAFKNEDMNLKEHHNKHCRHSKDFKPIWEGSPYLEYPLETRGIRRVGLYICNLCGLRFLKIIFGDFDIRQCGLYEWRGNKTNFKYKTIALPLDNFPKLKDKVEA